MNLCLLEGDEAGGGGANTGAAVEDGAVREGELGEVAADHLTLDFDVLEGASGVDGDDGADHLGHDDHVTEVGLDRGGLLADLGELLGLAELLHEGHGLALEAAEEASAGAGVEEGGELVGLLGDEVVELEAAEGELVEGALLLELLVALAVNGGHCVFGSFSLKNGVYGLSYEKSCCLFEKCRRGFLFLVRLCTRVSNSFGILCAKN